MIGFIPDRGKPIPTLLFEICKAPTVRFMIVENLEIFATLDRKQRCMPCQRFEVEGKQPTDQWPRLIHGTRTGIAIEKMTRQIQSSERPAGVRIFPSRHKLRRLGTRRLREQVDLTLRQEHPIVRLAAALLCAGLAVGRESDLFEGIQVTSHSTREGSKTRSPGFRQDNF